MTENHEQVKYLEENEKLSAEVKRLQLELEKYKYDGLTGLPGRIDFNKLFDKFWNDFAYKGEKFILAMVDINGLHAVNRDISFLAGDELIIGVSNQIKSIFAKCNFFRIGGDEFVILSKATNIEMFNEKLDKVQGCEVFSALADSRFKKINDFFGFVDSGIISRKKLTVCERADYCPYQNSSKPGICDISY